MDFSSIDIHCDLLSYLQDAPNPQPKQLDSIGCSFPALTAGKVKLQVMAIYSATENGSSLLGLNQCKLFNSLLINEDPLFYAVNAKKHLTNLPHSNKTGILAAIENASGFCEENEKLEQGFKRLEEIIQLAGKIFYIGFTHHGENRFGGGNSTQIGLKPDGKTLLHYLNGKQIAVDFSHASDELAHDLLDFIAKESLNIPILASHSNFRPIWNHKRNLTDSIAKEIIAKDGLIGINFLRAFVNNDNPEALFDHIEYGLKLGAENSICLGADYFQTEAHPDQSRTPFFFKEHENASCYPKLLETIAARTSNETAEKIGNLNVIRYLNYIWK
jgi:microsomal dipeptidase-like Zn-dependent dipeptidase